MSNLLICLVTLSMVKLAVTRREVELVSLSANSLFTRKDMELENDIIEHCVINILL